MYLSALSDEELQHWVKRVAKWLSNHEREKIASELERRRLKVLSPMAKARMEKKAGEEAKKADDKRRLELVRQWRKQGCAKDSTGNWRVPYELIWRSLPSGEDR